MYFHDAVIPTLKINNNFFKISNIMSTWNFQLSSYYGPHVVSDYVLSLLTHKIPLWYFLFPFLLIYLLKKTVHLSPQNFSGLGFVDGNFMCSCDFCVSCAELFLEHPHLPLQNVNEMRADGFPLLVLYCIPTSNTVKSFYLCLKLFAKWTRVWMMR